MFMNFQFRKNEVSTFFESTLLSISAYKNRLAQEKKFEKAAEIREIEKELERLKEKLDSI